MRSPAEMHERGMPRTSAGYGVVPTTTQLNLNVCGSFPSLKCCLVSSASRGLARLVISPPEASRASFIRLRDELGGDIAKERTDWNPCVFVSPCAHADEYGAANDREVVKDRQE